MEPDKKGGPRHFLSGLVFEKVPKLVACHFNLVLPEGLQSNSGSEAPFAEDGWGRLVFDAHAKA